MKLTFDRYIVALKRIREQINNGNKFEAEDSTTIGNKYTHCSWGLCSCNHEQWPDKEDHMFKRTIKQPLAVKYLSKRQICPFDKTNKQEPEGCFHRCMIFQDRIDKLPNFKEKALELYDIKIKEKDKI